MLATALVSFREGVEAFLIVALTLAYLRKSGRVALTPAVYGGTIAGIALSFVAGWLFSQADNKPLWEGLLAAIAGAMANIMVICDISRCAAGPSNRSRTMARLTTTPAPAEAP